MSIVAPTFQDQLLVCENLLSNKSNCDSDSGFWIYITDC